MYLSIQKVGGGKQVPVVFPATERNVAQAAQKLGLHAPLDTPVEIVKGDTEELTELLTGCRGRLDEINFLAKKLTGMNNREGQIWKAVVSHEKARDIASLINTAFTVDNYRLATELRDLESIGQQLNLEELQQEPLDNLNGLQHSQYAVEAVKRCAPIPTPCGLLFESRKGEEPVYNGIQFPFYDADQSITEIALNNSTGETEFIYLPCEELAVTKALHRLGDVPREACQQEIIHSQLPERVHTVCGNDLLALNRMAGVYQKMSGAEQVRFGTLCDWLKIGAVEEVEILADDIYKFDILPHAHTPEEYGRHLVDCSSDLSISQRYDRFFDYAELGQTEAERNGGAFTKYGYLAYFGTNETVQRLLQDNLGMQPTQRKISVCKLYAPLRGMTFYESCENDFFEESTEPSELLADTLAEYENEIQQALSQELLEHKEKRGLMAYYDKNDGVNRKVISAMPSIENRDGRLWGVTNLEITDELTAEEVAVLKETFTGQMSDGFGEFFEQRPIRTDLGDIYVSFWNGHDTWEIKTAEEWGFPQNDMMEMEEMML